VYVAELSGNIRCLDLRSGQEYWHYRTIENEDPEEFAPGFNAPVTLSATAVFVGDEEGTLHAVDRESGRPLWKPFDSEGEIKGGATLLPPDPATGAPRVMFGSHDGKLYSLNAATGEQLWAFDTLGPVNGSQAATPDSVRPW
jgi:outer membrane protein assembly factor BamB